ncbi:MAG: type II secretion system protein [Kiritimatiellia bacterium]
MNFSKKGFTLVELLIVMSIIGILAAALVVSMPKVSERARDMKCKTNLRNLAQASLAYAVQNGAFPLASPTENVSVDSNNSGELRYTEVKGWVNWTGAATWPSSSKQFGQMSLPQMTGDLAFNSITNGSLWSYTSKDASIYCCPAFKKQAKADGMEEVWRSYVMNYYFRWHGQSSLGFHRHNDFAFDLDGISRTAETVLMFAELPKNDIDTSPEGGDGRLDPENADEYIGFNHRVGKRNISHIAYADGHVGVLMEPLGGAKSDLKELTEYLCLGDEVDRSLLRSMH